MKRLKYILLLTLLSGCSLNQKQTQVPPVKEVAVKAPVSRELINNESEAKVKPSNVIVIVADQMRRASLGVWNDAKYQGKLNGVSDQVVTPNLDALAKEGALFTQAIANYPLCSPFRGMLLSGLYPNNNGVSNNTRKDRPNVGLRTDITTLPETLHQAGYNTALVGKGHWKNNLPLFNEQSEYVGTQSAPGGHFMQGTDYDTFIPAGPHRNKFEYWYQTVGHHHKSPTVYTNDTFISGKPEGVPFYPRVYSSVDQANVIIDYIKNSRQQRDDKKAFGLLWAMDPPHNPYDQISDTDEQLYNRYYKDMPLPVLLNRPNVDVDKGKRYARYHFSMITLIDREIGRVVNTLKEQGLYEDTLIVFTADHGEMMASHSRMAKNTYYEESLGIPLIVHHPNKVMPKVNDLLISVPDFMPTILGLLDLKNETPKKLDGTDYSDYLLGKVHGEKSKPLSSLYYGKSGELGLRTDQYTFALNKDGQLLDLFDNLADPYQLSSLTFKDIPEKDAEFLKAQLGFWLAHIKHTWYKQKRFTEMVYYPD